MVFSIRPATSTCSRSLPSPSSLRPSSPRPAASCSLGALASAMADLGVWRNVDSEINERDENLTVVSSMAFTGSVVSMVGASQPLLPCAAPPGLTMPPPPADFGQYVTVPLTTCTSLWCGHLCPWCLLKVTPADHGRVYCAHAAWKELRLASARGGAARALATTAGDASRRSRSRWRPASGRPGRRRQFRHRLEEGQDEKAVVER